MTKLNKKDSYKTFTLVLDTGYYNLFAFLEAVDHNPFLLFSQKLLIIDAICYNRSIPCVISFKKLYTFIALSSVLYEI